MGRLQAVRRGIYSAQSSIVAVTLDPSFKDANLVLSNVNRTVNQPTNNITYERVQSTTTHSTGKYYVEVTIDAISAGPHRSSIGIQRAGYDYTGWAELGTISTYDCAFYSEGTYGGFIGTSPFGNQQGYPAWANGQIIGIAIDLDASPNRIYINPNNVGWWGNVGGGAGTSGVDPAAGTNGIDTTVSPVPVWFAVGFQAFAQGGQMTVNFGPSFTYTKPTGFSAW